VSKRNWSTYTESLIERGHILMDIGFIKSQRRELKSMNNKKVGRPFLYPDSYVQFLAFLKVGFSISYRTVQGIVRGLAEYIRIEEIHFTQLRRRIKRMCTNFRDNYKNEKIDESITLVIDASGLTISKKGTYIEDKWRKERREYLKLHIAVDVKSRRIISFRVTKGTVHDSKKFVPMIKEISKNHRIAKIYADKAYDSKTNFNLLDKLHIEPVISIRKNANDGRTRKCKSRNELVHLIQNIGYDRYKKLKDTGQRWIAEVVFSSLKRVLGEHLLSSKFNMQKVETALKIMLYNRFVSL